MSEMSVEELERMLGREETVLDGPSGIRQGELYRLARARTRRRLVEQFHELAISARLNRRVGNEAGAALQEEQARTILVMIGELDGEADLRLVNLSELEGRRVVDE